MGKKSAAGDRKNIRTLRSAMKADLDKTIARAIQLGEAKAKAVQQRALSDINKASNALLTTASAKIEAMADNVFKLVKGKGSNLASIGDLLQTVSAVSKVKPVKAEGVSEGSPTLKLIFSNKDVKALGKGAVSKINGLVNEYI